MHRYKPRRYKNLKTPSGVCGPFVGNGHATEKGRRCETVAVVASVTGDNPLIGTFVKLRTFQPLFQNHILEREGQRCG